MIIPLHHRSAGTKDVWLKFIERFSSFFQPRAKSRFFFPEPDESPRQARVRFWMFVGHLGVEFGKRRWRGDRGTATYVVPRSSLPRPGSTPSERDATNIYIICIARVNPRPACSADPSLAGRYPIMQKGSLLHLNRDGRREWPSQKPTNDLSRTARSPRHLVLHNIFSRTSATTPRPLLRSRLIGQI